MECIPEPALFFVEPEWHGFSGRTPAAAAHWTRVRPGTGPAVGASPE